MRKFYVYQWRNLQNGKLYIGKGFGDRAKTHMRGRGGAPALRAAIAKYGVDSFELTFLHTEISEEEANELEMFEIERLQTKGPGGYNLTSGGEGATGWVPGAEWRKKHSAHHLGVLKTEGHRENIRKGLTGKAKTDAHKLSLRAAHLGVTPDTVRALETSVLAALREGYRPKEVAARFGVSVASVQLWARRNAIPMYDRVGGAPTRQAAAIEGMYSGKYRTTKEAARAEQCSQSKLIKALRALGWLIASGRRTQPPRGIICCAAGAIGTTPPGGGTTGGAGG
jgi:group I intron endonuclease